MHSMTEGRGVEKLSLDRAKLEPLRLRTCRALAGLGLLA